MAYARRTRPASRGAVRIPRTTACRGALAAAVALCLLHTPHAAASAAAVPEEPVPLPCRVDDQAPPKRQLRAEWIAGVYNIDWPSRAGLTAEQQRAELTELYDQARDDGLNAVFVQIRPTADAFWPSPHEPWSEWLTGEQGRDPGYDPLAFAVAEAHERNLEFHGWFNPYRVAMHDDPSRLAEDHPARLHPDWVFDYGGRLYYDPGVPEVRAFVVEAMMDAVENYDLDGVHFDDYFYPYPVAGQEIPDQDTFDEYGGGSDDIGDWRRENVDRLVREMDEAVHDAKPHVKFGVSPFGIWRNAGSDPAGSDTNGFESYDGIYADSRRWVAQGWVDYINPQVYWEIGLPVADYAVLVPWWEDVVADTDVQLYIGQAAYKAGNDGAWSDPAELARHLEFNRDHPGVDGDVYFSATSLRTNARTAMDAVVAEHYAHPALIPVKADLGGSAPAAPVVSRAEHGEDGTRLTIRPRPGEEPAYYAVYAIDGPPDPGSVPCRIEDPRHLLGTVRADGDRPAVFTAPAHEGERTYYATALDRLHHESPPGNPRHTP
ncbi:glycoside hydrolase family 10 protein [Nocardiopsis sp. YSL2]|uniref:glycoside hydrolase family 10 protein n=1 Tax=Nocardiopsis sp. YSL2 TaxID=2939492 RepID=UPI0026F41177|nr:family 10 glycosylhydrolase [Nocardiopsis sp. YSL2]